MARRKAAGKDSRAKPRRVAGGGRKSGRKPAGRKAARKKPAAKAAPPRKRPPAKARKPRLRAAPRPGGRARKAARPDATDEVLLEEPGDALDPELAERARSETALLGRGPNWWNSSLGGTKPGGRVPPELRRGAREDDPGQLAAQPPIPIGIFALPRSVPDPEPVEPRGPSALEAPADPDSAAPIDEVPADIDGDDDEPLAAVAVEPVEPPDEVAPRPPATPGPPAMAGEPEPGPGEPAAAGSEPAAPSASGVMQVLLGTVARSRPDGPGAVPPEGRVPPKDRPLRLHAPAEALMTPVHGAKGAPPPAGDHRDRGDRKPGPADLEALDAEIASSLSGLDELDGAEELRPRDMRRPRASAAAEPGPAEPGPAPLRPPAPPREDAAGAAGPEPSPARLRREAAAAAAAPAKKSPSPLVAVLAVLNYPLRRLPPSSRRIVGWIAASLLLWVPIVWLIALYFIGR